MMGDLVVIVMVLVGLCVKKYTGYEAACVWTVAWRDDLRLIFGSKRSSYQFLSGPNSRWSHGTGSVAERQFGRATRTR